MQYENRQLFYNMYLDQEDDEDIPEMPVLPRRRKRGRQPMAAQWQGVDIEEDMNEDMEADMDTSDDDFSEDSPDDSDSSDDSDSDEDITIGRWALRSPIRIACWTPLLCS